MCGKKPGSNVTKITVKDKNAKKNILNSCWGKPEENWEDNDTLWDKKPHPSQNKITK